MENLDDRAFVTRLDPKGMLALTENFPGQCGRALEIAREADLPPLPTLPRVVMLTGLGGSAAGGDFARALFDAHGGVPFQVNREYAVPNYVGIGDLVFCASYSGNTEETLSAYASAKKSGAKVLAITSGGELARLCEQSGDPVIRIPSGQPPRTALGYMLVPVLVACERLKLLPAQDYDALIRVLESAVRDWTVQGDDGQPKRLAEALHGRVGILYGLGPWQGLVANRWKGQINENAKNMAFSNAFPELNHNEILGWVRAREQGVREWAAIVLEDGTESAKMRARAEATERLVGDAAAFYRVRARGDSLLERMLSLALFGDFLSLYLAALNGVDPENIDSINALKAELSNVR